MSVPLNLSVVALCLVGCVSKDRTALRTAVAQSVNCDATHRGGDMASWGVPIGTIDTDTRR